MLRIDHVMYGVRDLEAGAARFLARYGLASVEGGRHVGIGTANRIVPLGSDYIELIAVVDGGEAAAHPTGSALAELLLGGDRPLGWIVRTDDIAHEARRLGLDVLPMSRRRPDGVELVWRLAGAFFADPSLPTFIQWDVPDADHPARAAAAHRNQPAGIAWLEVAGDAVRLREWLDGDDLPVRVVHGPPSLRAFAVTTGDGEVVIR